MKRTSLRLACLMLCFWFIVTHAGQLGGNIGFSGIVQLDSSSVETATKVYLANSTNSVTSGTGTFNGIASGTPVNFTTNTWPINSSGPITNFWSVGPYTFNLNSSTGMLFTVGGSHFLNIIIQGSVNSNGVNSTFCTGSFSTQDPPADGINKYVDSMSFPVIPAPPNLVVTAPGSANATIAWPTNSSHNYTLQQNTNLLSTNWTTSAYPVTNGFGTNFCTVPLTNGNLFFRLGL